MNKLKRERENFLRKGYDVYFLSCFDCHLHVLSVSGRPVTGRLKPAAYCHPYTAQNTPAAARKAVELWHGRVQHRQ